MSTMQAEQTEYTDEDCFNIIKYYRDYPIKFIEEFLDVKTWSGMRMIVDSVWNHKRTSVRACHGISKTITAALVGVTFFNLYDPAIVITSAPTYRQVRDLLWKEVGAIYDRADLRGEYHKLRVGIDEETYMIGFSTDRATNIEGYHAPNILWILDEAKGLPEWLYDSIEGSLTGGNSRVLEISTTDGADQQCAFRRHHTTERTEWNCIRFSAFDSPFVNPNDYEEYNPEKNPLLYKYGKPKKCREWPAKLEPEIQLATNEWINDRIKAWSKYKQDLLVTKVFGRYSAEDSQNILPIEWVESAIEAKVDATLPREYGLDVARFGDDETVLFERNGGTFKEALVWGKKDTMETAGIVKQCIDRNDDHGVTKVDIIGIGAGVFDRLAEQSVPVIGVGSGAKAYNENAYFNHKAEIWFHAQSIFKEQYDKGNALSIPNDKGLIEELTAMRYLTHSDGRLRVEKKEEFKKRVGRSPDRADAFVYCLYHYAAEVNDDEYIPADRKEDVYFVEDLT